MGSLAPVLVYKSGLREFSATQTKLFEINTNRELAHEPPKHFEDALYGLLHPVVQLVGCRNPMRAILEIMKIANQLILLFVLMPLH
jgi:hypothetical protein